ncbi:MAG: cache domain-containing protein, partial [Desulfobacula sp.]|nr:cache domain-containing protein [Desulfobacula sp.]
MLNRISIKGRMYLIIASILVLFILMIGFAINSNKKTKILAIEKMGQALLEAQKDKIKVATHSMAVALSNMLKDADSEEKKINIVRKGLAGIRFEADKSGYFFVNKDTTMIAHIKKSLLGRDLKGLKDKNGVLLIQELKKQAESGGGFVTYIWDKPGKGDTPKLSYAQMIPGTKFWIGTGVYLDNIDAAKADVGNDISAVSKALIIKMGIISGIFFMGIVALCLVIVIGIGASLNEMIVNFDDVAKGEGDLTKRIKIQSKDELGTLAELFNLFMEKLQPIIKQLSNDSAKIDQSSSELVNMATD